LGLEVMILL